jgi:hypothetical protein
MDILFFSAVWRHENETMRGGLGILNHVVQRVAQIGGVQGETGRSSKLSNAATNVLGQYNGLAFVQGYFDTPVILLSSCSMHELRANSHSIPHFKATTKSIDRN